jgi:hypothetical protein
MMGDKVCLLDACYTYLPSGYLGFIWYLPIVLSSPNSWAMRAADWLTASSAPVVVSMRVISHETGQSNLSLLALAGSGNPAG